MQTWGLKNQHQLAKGSNISVAKWVKEAKEKKQKKKKRGEKFRKHTWSPDWLFWMIWVDGDVTSIGSEPLPAKIGASNVGLGPVGGNWLGKAANGKLGGCGIRCCFFGMTKSENICNKPRVESRKSMTRLTWQSSRSISRGFSRRNSRGNNWSRCRFGRCCSNSGSRGLTKKQKVKIPPIAQRRKIWKTKEKIWEILSAKN